MFASRLDVYGKRILIESFDSNVKTDLDHDFSYFLTQPFDPKSTDYFHVTIVPAQRRPRFWIPILKTKRSVLFLASAGTRRVCFFNSAWLEYSVKGKTCTIYSDQPTAAYEALYFVILSYLGEQLGLSGMHRIHGMGFSYKGQGVILLAPSGGGKSTLAMELLKREDFKIVSDDTPVLNEQGDMLAFPQRIALSEKPEIEPKYLRQFKRFNHSEKFVIGADYFNKKIQGSSEVQWLMILDSSGKKSVGVEEVSRLNFIWPVIKWLVLGLETPQIWELLLRSGRSHLKEQTKILIGRLRTAALLVSKSRVAVLERGPNPKATTEHLSSFLDRHASTGEGGPTKN